MSRPRKGSITHRRLAVLVAIAITTSGCAGLGGAGVGSVLTKVVAGVQDAEQILQIIDGAARLYFARRPDADKQARYATAMTRTRTALNVALRTSRASQALDAGQADRAFDDYRGAYRELTALLGSWGVVTPAGALAASSDGEPATPLPTPVLLEGPAAP